MCIDTLQCILSHKRRRSKLIKDIILIKLNMYTPCCCIHFLGQNIYYIATYYRQLTRVCGITRSISARCWEGDVFDSRPKQRHS